MQLKQYLNSIIVKVIAAVLIFFGFGMIHASSQIVEKLGSVLIGIGTLYFIVFLFVQSQKSKKSHKRD